MKIRTALILMVLVLAAILVGCDHGTKEDVSFMGNPDVDEIFKVDLDATPISRRYAVLMKLSDRLWNYLGSPSTCDAEVALYSMARLQQLVEGELKAVKIPDRLVDHGPLYRGVDGTPYRVMSRDEATRGAIENRRIAETREYLRQLQHFAEHYPNRIDSNYMQELFARLTPERKQIVKEQLRMILGRNPKWK